MEKKNFQLMIKIPLRAIDDVEARIQARKILEEMGADKESVKLQRICEGKAPVGIRL